MSELSSVPAGELRRELAALREETHRRFKELGEETDQRFKELDHRLTTSIAAAELKEANDVADIRRELGKVSTLLGGLQSGVGNVESLVRANHMAQIHLWGVTARCMKFPESAVNKATRKARKLLDSAK